MTEPLTIYPRMLIIENVNPDHITRAIEEYLSQCRDWEATISEYEVLRNPYITTSSYDLGRSLDLFIDDTHRIKQYFSLWDNTPDLADIDVAVWGERYRRRDGGENWDKLGALVLGTVQIKEHDRNRLKVKMVAPSKAGAAWLPAVQLLGMLAGSLCDAYSQPRSLLRKTPTKPYGLTEETLSLIDDIKRVKAKHPTWGYQKVADNLGKSREQIRYAWRQTGEIWRQGC